MTCWLVLLAAVFLSLERLCYVYISLAPGHFRSLCTRSAVAYLGEPVDVVRKLFYGFKGIQGAVFFGWCYVHGLEAPLSHGRSFMPLAIGISLVVAGQVLNWAVFYRLGVVGE
jgi:phosphatidyl-N-methylethanolamine N-methyltransferase